MFRKSQLSIFILLGVMLLIMIVVLIKVSQIQTTNEFEQASPATNLEPVESFLHDCFNGVLEEGVFHIGQTGGVYDPTTRFLSVRVPEFYYNNSKIKALTASEVERELMKYVSAEGQYCLDEVASHYHKDIEISEKEPLYVVVSVTEESVFADLEFGVTAFDDSFSKEFTRMSVSIPSELHSLIQLGFDVAISQLEFSDSICLSCMFDKSVDQNAFISVVDYADRIKIFSLINKDSLEEFRFSVYLPDFNCAEYFKEDFLVEHYCNGGAV